MRNSTKNTFYRAGQIQNWSWSLFLFVTPFYALFTLLYDVILTEKWSPLWFITFTAGTLIEVVIVAIARKTFLPWLLSKAGAGLYSITFAALVNMVRNGLVASMSLQLGLVTSVDWVARLVGAALMGVGLILFFVAIMGSRVQHDYVMNRLQALQKSLQQQKSSAAAMLQQENQNMLQQTQTTLLPRIDEIKKLLANKHARLDSVNELRSLVQEHVRPLSVELSQKSERLALALPAQPVAKVRLRLLSDRVFLRETISPAWVSILSAATFFAIASLLDQVNLQAIVLASSAEFLILWAIKLALPKHKYFSRGTALVLLLVIALISSVPDIIALLPNVTNFNSAALYSMVALTPAFIMVAVANVLVLDRARHEAEAQMQKDTEALARETALFEQQMWLAKRNWSFVIHGTVQAALTAAITRLSSTDELEPYQMNLVVQDLDRAREALTKTPTIEVDLAAALSAVVSTWQGICAISVQISPRAQRALDRDVNARMCVNEIVKETISNAVRHGEAKRVWVEVDRSVDELLHISVRNDGRPVTGELEHGVGTRMLDDLTLDWSLVNNRARGTVDFEANLPISILSA